MKGCMSRSRRSSLAFSGSRRHPTPSTPPTSEPARRPQSGSSARPVAPCESNSPQERSMAVLESKPFLAPASSAVLAQVDLVEPDCGIEDIAEAWEPGQRIVLRCRAELTPVFWEHTGIPRGEPVKLVGSATCL